MEIFELTDVAGTTTAKFLSLAGVAEVFPVFELFSFLW
jgi:hypothetical protein